MWPGTYLTSVSTVRQAFKDKVGMHRGNCLKAIDIKWCKGVRDDKRRVRSSDN